MKEENTKTKKRWLYYLTLGIAVLLLVAATVLTVYFVTKNRNDLAENPPANQPSDPMDDPVTNPNNTPDPGPGTNTPSVDDKPSGGEDVVKFSSPIDCTTYSVEYNAIYGNLTAKRWYRHKAVDFKADEGTEVRSMADGVVTMVSISRELGNLIVVDHGDGLETYYRFISPVDGLAVGSKVVAGQKIGEVAEAYGSEAFDGTHLHLEVFVNGTSVDPSEYLQPVLDEK